MLHLLQLNKVKTQVMHVATLCLSLNGHLIRGLKEHSQRRLTLKNSKSILK